MKLFPCGHAAHPDWRKAAEQVLAQLRAQMQLPGHASAPTLGLLYITDHYAGQAQELLDHLSAELPEVTAWSGTVGVGVCAGGVEHFDEPALALMLLDVPSDQYRVFSGVAPLPREGQSGFVARTALLHADGHTPDVAELIAEMAERTTRGYVFGGLAASRGASEQLAVTGHGNLAGHGAAGGVFGGGLSGVAFDARVPLLSRVTQGCQPVGPVQRITASQDNVVLQLDGQPALDVLMHTLGVSLAQDPQGAVEKVRATLVGLMEARPDTAAMAPLEHTGHFGTDTIVRHIIGLDGNRHGVALAQQVSDGMRLSFCQRNVAAARADLVRICAEIREELEPEGLELPATMAPGATREGSAADAAAHAFATGAQRIAGAIYVSCSGRGGPHFGGPSAELQLLRHALGDVPLVGFFAGGEIAHRHLYGYTGVLTVFVQPGH